MQDLISFLCADDLLHQCLRLRFSGQVVKTEDAYRLAAEPKELYIVPGAGHVDLYDRVGLIPFDKLESFFKEYLKK